MLVPFVLPGEKARVNPGKPPLADLVEVLEPSPERVAAPCPLFQTCGGCHYQHTPYEFQLARKVEILREQLQRVGKIAWEGEISVISGPDYGYRNRAQFHLSEGRIGYVAPGSHTLVPVDGECPICSPRLNQGLEIVRRYTRDSRFPKFVRSLEIFTNEVDLQVNVIEADRPVARHFYDAVQSKVAIDYTCAAGTFLVSPKSFFQTNRFLIDQLIAAALPTEGGTTALDLYAGVGLFALPLARLFKKVTAIEAGAAAARDLSVNAERAGLKIDNRLARVEEHLVRLDERPDFVLADPPRAGLGKSVTADLRRLKPPRVTVVSCDPATLARDLANLSDYKIDSLTLVDLFPQTYHLETIVKLSLK